MAPKQTLKHYEPHDRSEEAQVLYEASKESAKAGWTPIKTDPLPDGSVAYSV